MENKTKSNLNEKELDLFIKEQLKFLTDEYSLDDLVAETAFDSNHNRNSVQLTRDGRPNWIHFS